jgi:hypothetical protein
MKHVIAIVAVATSLLAAPSGSAATGAAPIGFELSGHNRDRLQLALHRSPSDRHHLSMSLRPAELAGLNQASLQGGTDAPLRFMLQREAGSLDCAGTGSKREARGTCRFTADASFAASLSAAGLPRPSEEQALTLTAVDARRDLVEGLRSARMPMPTLQQLIALAAVGVTADYVRNLAAVGYRPAKAADLIPLKALDISPAYITSLAKVGYGRLAPNELIQLKALGVTADFITGLQRQGYRDLPVSRLVQFKALGMAPEELDRTIKTRGARVSITPPKRR